MASATPSANPCLVAILLVIQPRSGSGARLVFHYPPDPLSAEETSTQDGSHLPYPEEQTSSSSSDDESSTEEDAGAPRSGYRNKGRPGLGARAALTDDEDEERSAKDAAHHGGGDWKPSWEPLLGLGSSGLAGLLAADRIWHKRRFELGINDLCFLGWPVFVRRDGFWRRQRTRTSGDKEASNRDQATDTDRADSETEKEDVGSTMDSDDPEDTDERSRKSQLTMFNVVFVLDPPTLEYSVRVRDMYQHVVKTFTRVLKYEQARNDYVWKESEVIQSIRSRHASQHSSPNITYNEIFSKSSLATAIATVYRAVSASRIASVNLSATTSISLQIPPVTSTSSLPALTEPPVPAGLWLTTFNDPPPPAFDVDDLAPAGSSQLSKAITLLLKEPPQRIIKDAQAAGGPLALPLSTFVAAINPTKSFHKIAMASHLSLSDVQRLASHLVYWRRAMAIPPLNQRDIYMVSPNADMTKLKSAVKAYDSAFSTLPGLTIMLSALSQTPRPWMTLIPSSDHKEAYYHVLAWLMKGGWVTQLKTYAFVRVDPAVKKAVREKELQERRDKKEGEDAKPVDEQTAKEDGDVSGSPNRRPSLMSRPSSDHRQSNNDAAARHDPNAASLILNPSRASPLESKWLDHIADSLLTTQYSAVALSEDEKVELRKYWLLFVKYFNGSEPLEMLPVREGLKRKLVRDLLGKMGLNVDHGVDYGGPGEGKGGSGKILVGIRHW